MECSLCQSILSRNNPFGLLHCGHSFCNECLEAQFAQFKEKAKCATCQTPFQTSSMDCVSKCLVYFPMCVDESIKCESGYSIRPHLAYLHFKSCPRHNRSFKFLNLNCCTHNELFCSDCLTEVLPSLHLVRLGKPSISLIGEKLEHIRELGSEGKKQLSDLRDVEVLLSSRLDELEQSKEQTLVEIRRVFGSLREALDVRERVLEQEVEEINKSLAFSLCEERERSRVWQGQLSMLGECVEEMEAWVRSSTSPHRPDPGLMVDMCLLEDALRNSLSSSQASRPISLSNPSSSSSSISHSTRDKHVNKRSKVDQNLLSRDSSESSTFESTSVLNPSEYHNQTTSQLRDRIDFFFSFPLTSFSHDPSLSPSHPQFSSSSLHSIFSNSYLSSFFEGLSEMGSVISSSSVPLPTFSIPPVDWSVGPPQHILKFYSQGNRVNQLKRPENLTYSPISKLFYVVDENNDRIQVFRNNPQAESEGRLEIEFLPPFGNLSSISFKSPSSVYYHEGLLYIADQDKHDIQVFREEDGTLIHRVGSGEENEFSRARSCTIYGSHLFVSDSRNHRIQKFSLPDLSHVMTFGSKGSEVGEFSFPAEIAIFNGKLYVADPCNDRLSVFDPDTGNVLYVIGPSLSNGEILRLPLGLMVSHNLLFVSQSHCISVFDVNDKCLYSFAPIEKSQDLFPVGMVMVNERLFVCDSIHHHIQVFAQE